MMLVDTPAPVEVEVSQAITHLCPFRNEVDRGVVTVKWFCDGKTFELHELASYLDSFARREISHEELVADVVNDLSAYDGIRHVVASFTTETAGMDVRVRRMML